MIRQCIYCPWRHTIITAQGKTVYICTDEDGGAFLSPVGLCGYCGTEDADHNEPPESEEEIDVYLYQDGELTGI